MFRRCKALHEKALDSTRSPMQEPRAAIINAVSGGRGRARSGGCSPTAAGTATRRTAAASRTWRHHPRGCPDTARTRPGPPSRPSSPPSLAPPSRYRPERKQRCVRAAPGRLRAGPKAPGEAAAWEHCRAAGRKPAPPHPPGEGHSPGSDAAPFLVRTRSPGRDWSRDVVVMGTEMRYPPAGRAVRCRAVPCRAGAPQIVPSQ